MTTAPLKKSSRQLVEEALAQVETISLDAARALHGSDEVLFVDLRDVRELEREGVIPGAFNAPRGMLEFWVDPESPYFNEKRFGQGQRLVLFCAMGWRSALAAKSLADMGVESVCHIEGGFTAWKAAGLAVAPKEKKA